MRKSISILPLLLGACSGAQFSVEITQEQIQSQLSQRFPIERSSAGLLQIQLSNPEVRLQEGSDRIHFRVDVATKLLPFGKGLDGSAQVSGTVRYSADDGTFFFEDPRLDELHLQNLPGQYAEPLRQAASAGLENVLKGKPIYRLDENDTQQALARTFLQDVAVVGGQLQVTLGIN